MVNSQSILKMFDGIEPNEKMLKNMMELHVVHVFVAIGSNKNLDYKVIWDILYCYCNFKYNSVYFSVYSKDDLDKEFLKKVIYRYGLESHVTLINNNNKDELLTSLLGCDFALISKDTKEDELRMLCSFGLPIITLDEKVNGIKDNNFSLYVTREPENVVAYIDVIWHSLDYRNRMINKSLEFVS